MKKFLLVVSILFLTISTADAKRYITEPLLVPESPYSGMTFYVYKPYNMPKDWYITLDGYPVKQNSDGMWVYGTSEGPNLVATNYVVGSVIPSMAGLTKWVSDAQVSELRRLPSNEIVAVQQRNFTRSQMAQGQNYSTYIPDWTFRSDFMMIGNWKGSVDRIGVLDNPAVPVAWKGKSPKVVYVWVGNGWHQINVRESQRPVNALIRENMKIKRLLRQTNFKWYEQDMPILAQQSRAWGYYWLGEIHISR
ncbi:MAG: hypothetical protein IJP96_03075 [Synergistaceae bacterium]|nr:hypothetical protein [Synergistaceae bacterium]MBQ6434952.1 hypothetical protein [Synergistaceae bacterium]MBR0074717.1 hypothetical protein [Synergistaceae bacterium]MBR0078925.1 hypothetical protein [Synergistaceae bacterium]MBR0253292.1 hypothetical protein [Synergistaceae bacterium]